jgi:succinoglycan biosynthesis protein ExoA
MLSTPDQPPTSRHVDHEPAPTCTSGHTKPRRWPTISVIMPVRNEASNLAGTLSPLLAQNYPADRLEVLIVDGRSDDATRAVAERLALLDRRIRVFDNPRRLSSSARNIGIRESRGELILIIDGHCQIDDQHLLLHLVTAFERSEADCLGRPQPLEVAGATALQQAIALARSSWLGHHPASFVYRNEAGFVPAKSVAVAYRRSVFERVGLFDERFDACEDVELNHRVDRAGLRCFFAPEIAVCYKPRSSLGGLFGQMARYGRGRVRLLRQHRETFNAIGFAPGVLITGLALGPATRFVWPPLWTAYLGLVALYLLIILGVSLSQALRPGRVRLLPWLPLIYVAVHMGTGWGIVREAAWRGRSASK